MPTPILATKLYIPPPRPKVVLRPRLSELLNEGLHRKMTLISAPAGYGKTRMLSQWIRQSERCVAWVSLDDGDNDPVRFLAYFIAALQMLDSKIGTKALALLHAPLLPPGEAVLTILLNELTAFPDDFAIVLDDYHVIGAKPVDNAVAYMLEHMPPQMHLVIATREDPNLPLARLRAMDQLTEIRAADLLFTSGEADAFLNQVMGLNLSAEEVALLETRTEGWITGLQLAALALQGTLSSQGREDIHGSIEAFAGDNRYIVDYLVEEVLQRQPEHVRSFLLQTSILNWLSGPLCDAVTDQEQGKLLLESLERGNLFVYPLDDKHRWFRYHQLFADVLKVQLMAEQPDLVVTLHRRASEWYEHNGLEIEAFRHAAAANDVERAERLIDGEEMPLQFRGAGVYILNWLESLPRSVLDARPSLWVTYASTLLFSGQVTAVELKLQAAEAALDGSAALQATAPNDKTRDLLGRVAFIRARLAVIQHDADTIIAQSRRALEYLHPDNLYVRTATAWALGNAYQLQGDRTGARQAYTEVIAAAKSFGASIYTTVATINLGQLEEADNKLSAAATTYRRALQLAGDPPQPMACEAFLGLARISCEWNDLDAAEQYGQQCLQLKRQMENVDTFASYEVYLARLRLAQGDISGAAAIMDEAEAFVRQHSFGFWMPDVTVTQVLVLLRQGNLAAAAQLALEKELPASQARVHLAQGDPEAALALLKPLRRQIEAKGWADERLKVMVLEAVAYYAHGENEQAMQMLSEALALARPGGFIRLFVDEGPPMEALLRKAAEHDIAPNYVRQLLAAFGKTQGGKPVTKLLSEPLTKRELDVLRLLGTKLDGPEISRELMVSLNTMRTHTKNIYKKLGVTNRQTAVRRAEELDLL